MVDTQRTLSALQTLLADNAAGDISAQDVRDLLVSVLPGFQPVTVGEYDDYFTENKESDWTAISADSGTETWSYPAATRFGSDRGLNVDFEDQSAQDFTAYVKPLSGIAIGDYIQTKTLVWGGLSVDTVDSLGGLLFTDGTTTAANAVWGGRNYNASEVPIMVTIHGTLTAMATVVLNSISATPPDMHMRLTYSAANTFQYHVSLDGINFTQLGSDVSKTMTPTHGGFGSSTYGASEPKQAFYRYFHSNVTS